MKIKYWAQLWVFQINAEWKALASMWLREKEKDVLLLLHYSCNNLKQLDFLQESYWPILYQHFRDLIGLKGLFTDSGLAVHLAVLTRLLNTTVLGKYNTIFPPCSIRCYTKALSSKTLLVESVTDRKKWKAVLLGSKTSCCMPKEIGHFYFEVEKKVFTDSIEIHTNGCWNPSELSYTVIRIRKTLSCNWPTLLLSKSCQHFAEQYLKWYRHSYLWLHHQFDKKSAGLCSSEAAGQELDEGEAPGHFANSWWDATKQREGWLVAFGRSGWLCLQNQLLLAQAELPPEGSANTATVT